MFPAHGITPETAGPAPVAISLTHAFDIHYALSQPTDLGAVATGRRILFYTHGGIFKGPQIEGEVLPGGSDWTLTGTNGVVQIDVNIAMRASNGDLIRGSWAGLMRAKPEVLASVPFPQKRAEIDPEEVYFRVAPRFESASKAHAWLAQNQFVASARFTRRGLSYRVMKVD